jgi:ribonuclease HII
MLDRENMSKKFDRSLIPFSPNLQYEKILWQSGLQYIAGVDEAGRGALAGPVAAGVVVLPQRQDLLKTLHGVRDSKVMRPAEREYWNRVIQETAICCRVGFASAQEIDDLGIVPATRLAAMRALAVLRPAPQHLLIDHISIPGTGLPETSLVKGDARSLFIACASVLAKVSRDALMVELDEKHPGYHLAASKGYGTAKHRAAIEEFGPCPVHRLSFSPFCQNPQMEMWGESKV